MATHVDKLEIKTRRMIISKGIKHSSSLAIIIELLYSNYFQSPKFCSSSKRANSFSFQKDVGLVGEDVGGV